MEINKGYNTNHHLLITGDITFQGKSTGFESAERFFIKLLKEIGTDRKKIILCPGNHDILTQESTDKLKHFDRFSYFFRKDNLFTYSGCSVKHAIIDDIFYLGINSSYKLNHKYGYADINKIDPLLRSNAELLSKGKLVKIAFLHHHILNKYEADTSLLRNSFDLITLLDHYGFTYILHGHQHFNQYILLGQSKIKMFGVRTFSMKDNVNGFNVYNVEPDTLTENRYIYLKDSVSEGNVGGYIESP